mmetsp:Transcript_58580/g.174412  ORF Transcript_58580/g.174412 Transcript_58580/m.174412 type:complete len:127 (+) Transcript_58580:450-830(+)
MQAMQNLAGIYIGKVPCWVEVPRRRIVAGVRECEGSVFAGGGGSLCNRGRTRDRHSFTIQSRAEAETGPAAPFISPIAFVDRGRQVARGAPRCGVAALRKDLGSSFDEGMIHGIYLSLSIISKLPW